MEHCCCHKKGNIKKMALGHKLFAHVFEAHKYICTVQLQFVDSFPLLHNKSTLIALHF